MEKYELSEVLELNLVKPQNIVDVKALIDNDVNLEQALISVYNEVDNLELKDTEIDVVKHSIKLNEWIRSTDLKIESNKANIKDIVKFKEYAIDQLKGINRMISLHQNSIDNANSNITLINRSLEQIESENRKQAQLIAGNEKNINQIGKDLGTFVNRHEIANNKLVELI